MTINRVILFQTLLKFTYYQKKMKTSDCAESPKLTFQQLSNVIKRVILGIAMISGFLVIIFMGPLSLMMTMLVIQVLCFQEILSIGYNANKIPSSLPYFRSLCWYFLVAANYFFSVETTAPHFYDLYKKHQYLSLMVTYHRFISFCIYLVGMIVFVVSLKKNHDSKQFQVLAWTHTLLIIIVLQSYMIIENIFNGLIWLILPVSLVILNDIFAYVFGRLWGRTPLIKLSPKKTWEGFIGGVVGTLISGFILANVMSKYDYFTCPLEYRESDDNSISLKTNCEQNFLFQSSFSVFLFDISPFFVHFLSMALFASIVAPFGGFCASGFKRAFKIKDFGDVIPGHGGIMDRFDCQFLMATFVNVYIFTFVRNATLDIIFEKTLYMDAVSQVQFYHSLKDLLEASGRLEPTNTTFS